MNLPIPTTRYEDEDTIEMFAGSKYVRVNGENLWIALTFVAQRVKRVVLVVPQLTASGLVGLTLQTPGCAAHSGRAAQPLSRSGPNGGLQRAVKPGLSHRLGGLQRSPRCVPSLGCSSLTLYLGKSSSGVPRPTSDKSGSGARQPSRKMRKQPSRGLRRRRGAAHRRGSPRLVQRGRMRARRREA